MSQATTADDGVATSTETIVRTVICPLETSSRKNEKLRTVIDHWQDIASYMEDMMPSFPEYLWGQRFNQYSRLIAREYDDILGRTDGEIMKRTADEAGYEVSKAFGVWKKQGKPGKRPSTFGEKNYAILKGNQILLESNDRGYGVKLNLQPYNPEWFHLNIGDYQERYLERILDGDASIGGSEIFLENGEVRLHLAVSEDIDVYEMGDVPRYMGVDIGENVIYALSVIEGGSSFKPDDISIEDVQMKTGGEFRYHRDRISEKRSQLQENGKKRQYDDLGNQRERYTDHVLHTASREIVKTAVEHRPCGIVLEDLTDYREGPGGKIHDWPYASLQKKIMYKATAEGIPVETINPAGTSITCRRCGTRDRHSRQNGETHFTCTDCGYEVHGDVNASMNIALPTNPSH